MMATTMTRMVPVDTINHLLSGAKGPLRIAPEGRPQTDVIRIKISAWCRQTASATGQSRLTEAAWARMMQRAIEAMCPRVPPGPHTTGVEWVIKVWWIYIVVVVLRAAGIYAFVEVVGFRTRLLTRKSSKTAEKHVRQLRRLAW